MTRTRRALGGVVVGLGNQVVAVLVGLWLTRFILSTIGEHDYGRWLVALQVLGYLALADFGIVALLPRQAAFATAGGDHRSVAEPFAIAARLVLWQVPVVALAAAVCWLLVTARWPDLATGLAIALTAFTIAFPLRVFSATLQGLQDLAFLGAVQLAAYLGNAAAVVLLLRDAGVAALAAGWSLTVLLPPLACWLRLRRRFPGVLPRRLPAVGWPAARGHLRSGSWLSVGQLANVLVHGVDVVIIGALLGPAAVVVYAVTGKLLAFAGNLPMQIAHAAAPGLSQMRAGDGRERLRQVTSALTQAVLGASGAILAVTLAANAGFVGWWVGADHFGGMALTVAMVTLAVVRHYATAAVYAVYSFGHERLLAVAGVGEGLVGAAATWLLVRQFGLIGAPLGALAGAALVTLPLMLPALARASELGARGLAAAVAPWLVRALPVFALAWAIEHYAHPRGVLAVAAAGTGAVALYAAVMLPFALRPPLREYVLQVVRRRTANDE